MTYMHIGGAERSLLGLLHAIDYTQYDVDLFLFSHEGEFMDMIPPQVNLLPEISAYRTLGRPPEPPEWKAPFPLSDEETGHSAGGGPL